MENEMELLKEKDFFYNLIALCPDSIIGIDRKGIIILFNRAAEKLTHYDSKDVIGKMSIVEIYGSAELARFLKKKIYSPESGGVGQLEGFEIEVADRFGRKIPIRLSATLVYDKEGQEAGSVGFFHDLTVRKQMESRLRELSITDSLSGLFNQRHFYSVLEGEIEKIRTHGSHISLICFDIDNFKHCNDKLGHLEGDNIIRSVGQMLTHTLRPSDMAFRYGGDEFMVILPETDLISAVYFAEKIRNEFNARWPFDLPCGNEISLKVTLSMGLAQISPDEKANLFIKRADLAMYEAKRAGGDRIVKATQQIGEKLRV